MDLERKIARLFAMRPQVEATALGGSLVGDKPDASSDIDIYVNTRAELPLIDQQSFFECLFF